MNELMFRDKYEKAYSKQKGRIEVEIEQKTVVEQEKFNLLKSMLPVTFEDKVILDIGGGAGGIAVQASKAQCQYIVIDLSCIALKLGKLFSKKLNLDKKIDFILADANKLPIKNGSVDIALFTDVIEHVAEPQRLLVEAKQVLQNEGYLFLTVPYAFGPEAIILDQPIRLAYALKIKKEVPTHLSAFTVNQLRGLLEYSGFKSKESRFYSASYLLFVINRLFPNLSIFLGKTFFHKNGLAMFAKLNK